MKIKKLSSFKSLLMKYIRSRKLTFVFLLVFLVICGFLEIYPVRYMQKIIDMLVEEKEFSAVLLSVSIWYSFRIILSISTFLVNIISGNLSTGLGKVIREEMFNRMRYTKYKYLENASMSDAAIRTLNDVADIGDMIIKPFTMVGKNLLIFLWSVFFLIGIDYVLLLASIPLGMVMLLSGQWTSKKHYKVFREIKASQTQIAKVLIDTISASREIIVNNLWGKQTDTFLKSNTEVTNAQKSSILLSSGLNSFIDAMWPIATVLCLTVGGYRVSTGMLSIGGLISFMWYVQWVIHPISQVSNYYSEVQKSLVAAERINEMLEWFPRKEKGIQTVEFNQSIELADISFRYGDGPEVLKNINFSLKKGEVVAIVGETGSGKSTLLKMIMGLISPTKGQLKVDDVHVSADQVVGSPSISAVFQDAQLFDVSVRQNVSINIDDKCNNKDRLLDRVIKHSGVSKFLSTLENGLDTQIGNNACGLSSGQKQRVALARSLAKSSSFLILDEATSTVDSATEEFIYNSLFSNYEYGCIITSHRLSSIMNADRIVMLKDGLIIGDGSHDYLVENCRDYYQLYKAQL